MFIKFIVLTLFFGWAETLQLQVPETVTSGSPVSVVWTLENGDPATFGLMQRSLQDDTSRKVTPVNTAGTSTGTAAITFDMIGQVLVAGIAETSLAPGQTFTQLAAGKQVTIVQGQTTMQMTSTTSSSSTIFESSTLSTSTVDTPTQISTTSTTFSTSSSISISLNTSFSSSTPSSSSLQSSSSSESLSTTLTPVQTTQPFSSTSRQSAATTSTSDASGSQVQTTSGSTRAKVTGITIGVLAALVLCLVLGCLLVRHRRTARRLRMAALQYKYNMERRHTCASLDSPYTRETTSYSSRPFVDSRRISGLSAAMSGAGDYMADAETPFDSTLSHTAQFSNHPSPPLTAAYYNHRSFPPSLVNDSLRDSSYTSLQSSLLGTPQAAESGIGLYPSPNTHRITKDPRLSSKLVPARRLPSIPARDSWSVFMSDEPLPAYMEPQHHGPPPARTVY